MLNKSEVTKCNKFKKSVRIKLSVKKKKKKHLKVVLFLHTMKFNRGVSLYHVASLQSFKIKEDRMAVF